MQAAGQLLYFIFLVAVFFVAPLWYQLFHNMSDKIYVTAAVLYISFTIGYYLIYVLMNTYRDSRGNLVLIGGVKRKPEDGFQSAESESTDRKSVV